MTWIAPFQLTVFTRTEAWSSLSLTTSRNLLSLKVQVITVIVIFLKIYLAKTISVTIEKIKMVISQRSKGL